MSTAPLQHAIFLQATGHLAHQSVGAVIFGWGEYADRVKLLPKPERDKLDHLADLIVTSFAQPNEVPFRFVHIVGHADKDGHHPFWDPKRRAAWEDTVSMNRAKEVEEELTARVRELWEERNIWTSAATRRRDTHGTAGHRSDDCTAFP
jgi:hypothetical protein